MVWLFFCFISIVFNVTYSLVSKKILNSEVDHNPIAYASALFGSVALFSFIAYFIRGPQLSDILSFTSPYVLSILFINIFCYTLAPTLYYQALKHLPISEVTILYSLTSIYILLFGVLLGTEIFVLSRFVGGMFIISSVIALTLKSGKWKSSVHTKMMVFATFLYAIAAITDKQIISNRYFTPLFFQTINFGLPSLFLLIFNAESRKHLKKIYNKAVYPKVVLNGAFFFVSFYTIYRAYSSGGEASQVAFVLSTETIVMVLVAALFLKERQHLFLKTVTAVVCALGVYLLR
jgi:drug/metabolite transporter (DMT)-like permease